jgi:sugar/nucleoside kinase (ribokinase family)
LKCSQDRSTEAAQLLKTGLRTAVLKRGNQGAIAFDKDGACHSGGYAVDAYDAIGSGDIFGAAYTYCLMNCLSTRQCVEFANVFAALSLVRYKERKQFPSEETVLKIIKEREEHLAQP